MSCKYCGCAGWLFSLDEAGLCEECAHLVGLEVEQRLKTIEDTSRAAEQTLNPHSKIAKLDIVVDNLEALARYERKGIPLPASPGAERDKRLQDLKRLVARTAGKELRAVLAQVAKSPSSGEKVKLLTDFRLKLESLDPRTKDSQAVRRLESRVRDAIKRVRISSAIEEAQSAERDGSRPAALKAYKEALLLLDALERENPKRASQKSGIDHKIKELA